MGKTANAAGENQQDQAMLDFLSVFATTQTAGADAANANGYWGNITIKNQSSNDAIKKALFGDGTQTNGMIDSKNVLIGGTAAPLGSAMTAESLAKFMGSKNVAYYQDWVEPLRTAMQEFKIDTPSRIAAFLAQIKQESGGMTVLVEDLRYRVSAAATTFGVFGKSEAAVRDFYEKELGLTAVDSTREKYKGWTDELNTKMAEKVYGSTTAKGKELGNKDPGDGSKYLGYGLKQLTGLYNHTKFADYLGEPLRTKVLADPRATIGTDKTLAARSAAYYWSVNKAENSVRLNDKALSIKWGADSVVDNQEIEFNKISAGVGLKDHPARWVNYQKIVGNVLKGGNPFENIRSSLSRLGIASKGDLDNKGQFSFSVRPSKAPVAIDKPLNLLAYEFGNPGTNDHATDELSLTSEQESLLLAQASSLLDQLKYSSQEKDSIMWIPNLKTNQMLAITALGLTTGLPAEAASDQFAAGVCQIARQTLSAEISPISNAASYILYHQNHLMRGDENLFDGAKIRILTKPKHGVLELEDDQLAVESSWYRYRPKVGFEGTDRFVMQVEKSGIKVKIYYVIEVLGDEAAAGYCPKESWKISSNLPTGTDDFSNWQTTASLNAMLANASGSLMNFSDLAGTAVGETKGAGRSAQITLDSTAAGHGWFIDATP